MPRSVCCLLLSAAAQLLASEAHDLLIGYDPSPQHWRLRIANREGEEVLREGSFDEGQRLSVLMRWNWRRDEHWGAQAGGQMEGSNDDGDGISQRALSLCGLGGIWWEPVPRLRCGLALRLGGGWSQVDIAESWAVGPDGPLDEHRFDITGLTYGLTGSLGFRPTAHTLIEIWAGTRNAWGTTLPDSDPSPDGAVSLTTTGPQLALAFGWSW
jgi:hypothetical protein